MATRRTIWERLRSLFRRDSSSLPDGRRLEQSARPLTSEEAAEFDRIRQGPLAELFRRYSLASPEQGLLLLQHTVADGSFHATEDLRPLGILWGDLIRGATGMEWGTAEWQGERLPMLQVPRTTVLVFPIAMLEKRRDRREPVDFVLFLDSTVATMADMRRKPEYQR